MERIERIRKHPLYQSCMEQIETAEQTRIYCKHTIEHALDVARIAYIRNLEDGKPLEQDIVYAMALLHDIGRCREYQTGESHHSAGKQLAESILQECGFSETEISCIIQAIAAHKHGDWDSSNKADKDERRLDKSDKTVDYCKKLLYEADKLSRNCYCCKARETCYWTEEIRNHSIKY